LQLNINKTKRNKQKQRNNGDIKDDDGFHLQCFSHEYQICGDENDAYRNRGKRITTAFFFQKANEC